MTTTTRIAARQEELSDNEIYSILDSGDPVLLKQLDDYLNNPFFNFVARPDAPDDYDEQTGFVNDFESKFSVCLGGTGSGKTLAAAHKTYRYLLNTPPFRERCPFWIIGETYKMACGICWDEKLSRIIPKSHIHTISWLNETRNWPAAVSLKHPDDPTKIGWVLDFLSYAQGRDRMQGASIGGFWFNEEVPIEIVEEVHGRTREYDCPGWADFTPLQIKSPEWIEYYNAPPRGWRFYHLNSLKNTALPPGFMERYLESIPEDMRETRTTGVFSVLRGQVFKEWRPHIHIIEEFEIPWDWRKFRGLDFGFSNPYVCLWAARDHDNRWYFYDEHYENQQLHDHHVAKIKQRAWPKNDPTYGQTYSDHDPQERAELAARGIHTIPAIKSIHKGIEVLRKAMAVKRDGRPSFYVFRKCKNLIREIPGYQWPDGTDRRNPNELPNPVDDHAIDACRYIIASEELSKNQVTPQMHYKPPKEQKSSGHVVPRTFNELGRRRSLYGR
jgi:phage terminase large subunit